MNIPEQDIDKLLTEFCRAEVERAPRQHRLGWQDWPPLARTRSIWVGASGCTSSKDGGPRGVLAIDRNPCPIAVLVVLTAAGAGAVAD